MARPFSPRRLESLIDKCLGERVWPRETRSSQHVQQPSVAQLINWRGYIAFFRSLAILGCCNWALKVRGTSIDNNLVGGPSVARGICYGALDSPAGPSMAAIDSPAGPSMATKLAVDGPAGPFVGGPSVA